MKRFIAMAVLAALLAIVAVPSARSTDYNPDLPPWAYLMQAGNEDSGDDSGWGNPGMSQDDGSFLWQLLSFDFGICRIIFIGTEDQVSVWDGIEHEVANNQTSASGD